VAAALAVLASARTGAAATVTIGGPPSHVDADRGGRNPRGGGAGATVAVAPGDAATASARIEDSARATVSGRRRRTHHRGPGRDCAQRARVAAVFIALTLFPPSAGVALAARPTTQPDSRPVTPTAATRASDAVGVTRPKPRPPSSPGRPIRGPSGAARSSWRRSCSSRRVQRLDCGPGRPAALRAGTRHVGLALGAEVDGDLERTLTRGTARLSRYAFDLGAFAAWNAVVSGSSVISGSRSRS